MSNYKPSYLDRLNEQPDLIARFITRQQDLPVTRDRKMMLDTLRPRHDDIISEQGIPPRLLRTAEQVHGDNVALVGDIGCYFPVEGVDALVCSRMADCCLGIYVADCAAVWLYDTVTGARGLLHSGKIGTELNIVAKTLKALKKYEGTKPKDCIAVISPCIRPPHYEVDIVTAIKQQLLDAGLDTDNIIDSNLDTASDTDTFYSYRVERGKTGRMLALFGRVPH